MRRVKGYRYLFRRGEQFYFRRRVPKGMEWAFNGRDQVGVAALGGMFLFSTYSDADGASAGQGLTAEPTHSDLEQSTSLEQPQPAGQPVGTLMGSRKR